MGLKELVIAGFAAGMLSCGHKEPAPVYVENNRSIYEELESAKLEEDASPSEQTSENQSDTLNCISYKDHRLRLRCLLEAADLTLDSTLQKSAMDVYKRTNDILAGDENLVYRTKDGTVMPSSIMIGHPRVSSRLLIYQDNQLYDVLVAMDSNNDGTITQEEYKQSLESIPLYP